MLFNDMLCLHDTVLNNVTIEEGQVVLSFNDGVYKRCAKGFKKTEPCEIKLSIKGINLNTVHQYIETYEIKDGKIREKSLDDVALKIRGEGLNIYHAYCSFFAKAILFTGNVAKSEFSINITDVDHVCILKGLQK